MRAWDAFAGFDYHRGGREGKKKHPNILTNRWQNNISFAGQLTDIKIRLLKCKWHVLEFWCTMELSWQLRSENVKAVSQKKPHKKSNEPQQCRETASAGIIASSHGWISNFASLLQRWQHIRASIHALESNECNSLGPVFIPFYDAQINKARAEDRRDESDIVAAEGRRDAPVESVTSAGEVVGFCLLWQMAVTEKSNGAGSVVLKAMVSVAKPRYKSSFLIKRAQATY